MAFFRLHIKATGEFSSSTFPKPSQAMASLTIRGQNLRNPPCSLHHRWDADVHPPKMLSVGIDPPFMAAQPPGLPRSPQVSPDLPR